MGDSTNCPATRICTAPLLTLALALTTSAASQSTVLTVPAAKPSSPSTIQPQSAVDWLRRADDLMNLRLPGSPPFHLRVTFHAWPAYELDPSQRSSDPSPPLSKPVPGHPYTLVGDGIYEETWLSREQWRREATFGTYHAVEIRANGVRKFEASEDYEPGAVLILLRSLFNPVSSGWLQPELDDRAPKWKLEHLSAGSLPYLRISYTHVFGQSEFSTWLSSYEVLPAGILVRSGEGSVTTSWQDDRVFGARVVPGRVTISAMGHVWLDARVTIDSVANSDPAAFNLPGGPASPGMTLVLPSEGTKQAPRPVHEVVPIYPPQLGAAPGSGVRVLVIIDRRGIPREMEVIDARPLPSAMKTIPDWLKVEAAIVLKSTQQTRWHPAEVDNDPCESFRIISAVEGLP